MKVFKIINAMILFCSINKGLCVEFGPSILAYREHAHHTTADINECTKIDVQPAMIIATTITGEELRKGREHPMEFCLLYKLPENIIGGDFDRLNDELKMMKTFVNKFPNAKLKFQSNIKVHEDAIGRQKQGKARYRGEWMAASEVPERKYDFFDPDRIYGYNYSAKYELHTPDGKKLKVQFLEFDTRMSSPAARFRCEDKSEKRIAASALEEVVLNELTLHSKCYANVLPSKSFELCKAVVDALPGNEETRAIDAIRLKMLQSNLFSEQIALRQLHVKLSLLLSAEKRISKAMMEYNKALKEADKIKEYIEQYDKYWGTTSGNTYGDIMEDPSIARVLRQPYTELMLAKCVFMNRISALKHMLSYAVLQTIN